MSFPQSDLTGTRYSRHNLIPGWNQQRLASAKVLVVGAGALGNEVIKLLALVGVGNITIVDFDKVELTNLTRSVLFREEDIGQSKAEVAAHRAMEINPDFSVIPIHADLEFDLGMGILRSMDIVLGCLDSIRCRLTLNRMCRLMGIPWINGGIEMNAAESTIFHAVNGACYECGLSQEMWNQQNLRHSCSGLRTVTPEDPVPTTAPIASITAGYMVQQALASLHSSSTTAFDASKIYLTFDPPGMSVQMLNPNPNCMAHENWSEIKLHPFSATNSTPGSLMRAFGIEKGVLELGFDLLTEIRCLKCGKDEKIMQPNELCSSTLIYCPHCSSASRIAITIHQIEAASEFFETSLSFLCIPDYQILELIGDNTLHVQITGEWQPVVERK